MTKHNRQQRRARMERVKEIKRRQKEGETMAQIAIGLGLKNRQGIWNILNRHNYP